LPDAGTSCSLRSQSHEVIESQAKERAARKGRNPQTGEEISIPASKKVAFRPAKSLRDAVGASKKASVKKK